MTARFYFRSAAVRYLTAMRDAGYPAVLDWRREPDGVIWYSVTIGKGET